MSTNEIKLHDHVDMDKKKEGLGTDCGSFHTFLS